MPARPRPPDTPLYLQRRGYRSRRLIDACRVLPFIGGLLWLIPLLWPQGGAEAGGTVPTSSAVIYVFGVWCVLIVAGALLAARVPDRDAGDGDGVGAGDAATVIGTDAA